MAQITDEQREAIIHGIGIATEEIPIGFVLAYTSLSNEGETIMGTFTAGLNLAERVGLARVLVLEAENNWELVHCPWSRDDE